MGTCASKTANQWTATPIRDAHLKRCVERKIAKMSKIQAEGEIQTKENPMELTEEQMIYVAAANPKEMKKKATLATRAGGMIERMRDGARERKIARKGEGERQMMVKRERKIENERLERIERERIERERLAKIERERIERREIMSLQLCDSFEGETLERQLG